MQDASDGASESIFRHLLHARLEVLAVNWIKFQVEHERMCQMHAEQLVGQSYMKHRTYERCQKFYVQAKVLLFGRT